MSAEGATPGEIELEAGTVCVGDLHLDTRDEAACAAALDWFAGLADRPRLVILGDLFEYWLGRADARSRGAAAVAGALRSLTEMGVAVDVLHGNRDFLLGPEFERASGARVCPDGYRARAPQPAGRVLFIHGDELSTLDRGYQRLKRVLRSQPMRALAAGLPAPLTARVALRLRRSSGRRVRGKPPARVAQQRAAAGAVCDATGAQTLICGHAHGFRDEALEGGARWLVVDAFGGERDALELGTDGRIRARHSGDLTR